MSIIRIGHDRNTLFNIGFNIHVCIYVYTYIEKIIQECLKNDYEVCKGSKPNVTT